MCFEFCRIDAKFAVVFLQSSYLESLRILSSKEILVALKASFVITL
jgi:hypothetical protein